MCAFELVSSINVKFEVWLFDCISIEDWLVILFYFILFYFIFYFILFIFPLEVAILAHLELTRGLFLFSSSELVYKKSYLKRIGSKVS